MDDQPASVLTELESSAMDMGKSDSARKKDYDSSEDKKKKLEATNLNSKHAGAQHNAARKQQDEQTKEVKDQLAAALMELD